ncbi:hypothetical protein B0H15DRAFT_953380 [Mycena belliarum]|uniref:Uncharacterized protein n=1 Tax=Mycena belliarum TaxID=1033014 RepID=A0AAD6XMQ0_9AGAR|nr:hypothetical protein B0H15DRAFT_953380 [Mycena belliae]
MPPRIVPSAHARRNPGKQTQPSRRRATVSAAAKSTNALNSAERKRRRIALEDDIDGFYEFRGEEIIRLADLHSVKESVVRKMICNVNNIKQTRRPSLRSAYLHDMGLKAKADGSSKKLHELQGELAAAIEAGEVDLWSLGEEEEKRLLDQLIEHRGTQKRGMRATNRAAAMDGTQTAQHIGDSILDLFERTGIRGFAMFSRGNPDDAALPHVVDSDDALEFFQQVYDIPWVDALRAFERYSCSLDNKPKDNNNLSFVRKQIISLVLGGLRKVAKDRSANMSYEHYDYDIRELKACELLGWPSDITLERPSKMTAEHARKIRDMLVSGTIQWHRMSKEDHTELVQTQEAKRRETGAPAKKRAGRSDLGTKRGPQKNKKTSRKKGKAKATTDDESDDESDDDSGEDTGDENGEDTGDDEDEEDAAMPTAAAKSAPPAASTAVPTTTTTSPGAAGASYAPAVGVSPVHPTNTTTAPPAFDERRLVAFDPPTFDPTMYDPAQATFNGFPSDWLPRLDDYGPADCAADAAAIASLAHYSNGPLNDPLSTPLDIASTDRDGPLFYGGWPVEDALGTSPMPAGASFAPTPTLLAPSPTSFAPTLYAPTATSLAPTTTAYSAPALGTSPEDLASHGVNETPPSLDIPGVALTTQPNGAGPTASKKRSRTSEENARAAKKARNSTHGADAPAPAPRKQRSDKGSTRKPRGEVENDPSERTRKKRSDAGKPRKKVAT